MRTAILAALLAACSLRGADELLDPLPLRRVVLPPDQLPAVLKDVAGGVLARMSRKDFESLVKQAARSESSRRSPPRLVEARYRAVLADGESLSGTVQWKIRHAGAGPALMRLGDLNLALKPPRFENRDALLTEFPTAGGLPSPALLVDAPGEHTVTAEWSARADARPDGLHTELRLPACPASSLEIDLPEDCSLAGPEGLPISGPHPGERPGRRTWRVAAGSRATLPLLIRRSNPGRAAALFARQTVSHRLAPDGLEASHTFMIEALHQDVRELAIEHDPALRPVEVIGPEVERWEARPGSPPLLAIRLRRPARVVLLEVKALAPLCPDSQRGKPCSWSSPQMGLRGAVPRGEQLDIWLDPALEASAWQPGDFRLVAPRAVPLARGASRRLSLLGGGLASGKPAITRRPSLTVQAGAATFHVQQTTEWRIDPDGMALTTRLGYRMQQGMLFEFSVALPVGWEAESAEVTPAGLLRGWGVKSGNVLLAELARPLTADAMLTVRLRPTDSSRHVGRDFPIPDIVPLGARFREGGLGIAHDDQAWRIAVKASVPPGEPPVGWAGVYYPFVGEPPTGTLRLDARSPRIRARAEVDVKLAAGRAVQVTHLVLEVEGGRSASVEMFITGPAGTPWEWEPRPRSVERRPGREVAAVLSALGARSPLEAATLIGARPEGTFWAVSFARPMAPRVPLVLRSSHAPEPLGRSARPLWPVSLPVVLGAARMEGDVAVHLPIGEQATAEAFGLSELVAQRRPGAWRSFRYSTASARLSVRSRGGRQGASEARIDEARLVTLLSFEGGLRHRFTFRLSRWTGRTLPVTLPTGAQLISASVDGQWLEQVPVADGHARLPIPSKIGPMRIELRYDTPAQIGLIPRLQAYAPILPADPPGIGRLWLLPPGIRPLSGHAVVSLPGTSGQPELPLRYPVDALRVGPTLPMPGQSADPLAERIQAISAASEAIGHLSPEALVEELAFRHLREVHPLAVDTLAFGAAKPDATGVSSWERLGLAVLPARSGVLLTSRGQAEAWSGVIPSDVENAVKRAVSTGSDSTGRFVSALEWLRIRGTAPVWADSATHLTEGWTAWEPVAGADQETLVVVHARWVSGAGACLALLLLAGLVMLRRSSTGARFRWLVCGVVLSGIALAWLPVGLIDLARWPLVAGLALAIVVLLTMPPSAQRRAPSTAGPRGAVVAALLLVCLLAGAGAPAVEAVYLIAGAEPSVLLAPALKKKLEELAALDGVPSGGAVLVSARHEGRMSGAVAEFDSTYTLRALRDGAWSIELPIDGVQLVGDAMLDGARVLPRALPRGGYSISGAGRGAHRLQVKFRTSVTGQGEEAGMRQARFTVPRLYQTELAFRAPKGASYLHAPSRAGGQAVKADAVGPLLESDLGALSGPLLIRWYQEGKAPSAGKHAYREAHIWDLRPDASRLTTMVRYSLSGGTATLSFDVPTELEVMSAQARRPRGVVADVPVRLTRWAAENGKLQLEFAGPVSGEVECEVALVPRRPLVGAALLLLPRPNGEPGAGKSYLAYRATGVDVSLSGAAGLTGIKPNEFAADWPSASRPSSEGLAYAGTFRRDTPPQFRVEARPRTEPFDVEQRIRYTVGPRQATLAASIRILAGEAPRVLEFSLGEGRGLLVSSVEGPSVARWAQSQHALLVWLDGPTTGFEIAGWVARPKEKKPGPARFEMPCLRPAGAAKVRTEIVLLPESGSTLAVESLLQLTSTKAPPGRLAYTASSRTHGGRFLVRPGPATSARVTTSADIRGREVVFESRVQWDIPAGEQRLKLRLGGWPGAAELHSASPALTRVREDSRRGPDRRERVWWLTPVEGTSKLEVTLRGRVPVEEVAGGLPMPDVDAGPGERILAAGGGLAVVEESGVEAAGLRSWRVRSPAWSVRLVPRIPARAATELLLAHAQASVPDGKTWLHEISWWLRLDGPGEFRIELPGPVNIVGLEVDGVPWPVVQPDRGAVWLALPPAARPRQVRFSYRRDPAREGLDQPDLTPPQLDGVGPGPMVWAVDVPVGWDALPTRTPPAPAALGRAVVAAHLARAVPGVGHLRDAQLALSALGPEPVLFGPGGQELRAWLKGMGGELGESPSRDRTHNSTIRWLTPTPPDARFQRPGSEMRRAVAASLQWLTLWMVVLAAGHLSWLRSACRWLWPEILLAMGLLGWWLHGPALAVVLVVSFGSLARAVLLVMTLRRFAWTRANVPS